MIQSDTEQARLGLRSPEQGDAAPVLDLQQFCGTDEYRDYLTKPFCFQGFTWATNGHILVRVPLDDRYPPLTAKIDPSRVLKKLSTTTLWAKLQGTLPPRRDPVTCGACDGHGRDLENEEIACVVCGGPGKTDGEAKVSITIAGIPYALNYIRQMLALPDVEIAPDGANNQDLNYWPLLFRFTGGIGALMSLRSTHDDHVEMEQRPH